MAIAAVSISPTGAGPSVSAYVAAALRVVQRQDRVAYEMGSMFTTLEGEIGDIYALIQQMEEAVFAAGAVRVGTVIKVDHRRDRTASMADKLERVRALLEDGNAD